MSDGHSAGCLYFKALYAEVRDEEAAELTKKLEEKPKLPKRRWAYALKDTSTEQSAKVSKR